jgi:hypothetical protein
VVDQPSAGFAASVELVPIRKLVVVGVDELLEKQEIRWSWWPASWLSVETEHDTTVRPETPIRTSVVLAYGDVIEMAVGSSKRSLRCFSMSWRWWQSVRPTYSGA